MRTSSKIAIAFFRSVWRWRRRRQHQRRTLHLRHVRSKYLGRWVDTCDVMWSVSEHPSYPNGVSESEDITIGKISANQYGIVTVERTYHNTKCAGSPVTEGTILGTAQIRGTKTVAFGAVDKVILEQGDAPLKLITQVVDGRHYYTSSTSPGIVLDAGGYPEAVAPTAFLTPVSH